MSSQRNRISLLLPLATLLLASACATPGELPPPVADLTAVTETKPIPGDEIATSQKAADDYSASVEGWGDRVSAAGARLCRWVESVYKPKGLDCPKPRLEQTRTLVR